MDLLASDSDGTLTRADLESILSEETTVRANRTTLKQMASGVIDTVREKLPRGLRSEEDPCPGYRSMSPWHEAGPKTRARQKSMSRVPAERVVMGEDWPNLGARDQKKSVRRLPARNCDHRRIYARSARRYDAAEVKWAVPHFLHEASSCLRFDFLKL
jgi:hypothetical protein